MSEGTNENSKLFLKKLVAVVSCRMLNSCAVATRTFPTQSYLVGERHFSGNVYKNAAPLETTTHTFFTLVWQMLQTSLWQGRANACAPEHHGAEYYREEVYRFLSWPWRSRTSCLRVCKRRYWRILMLSLVYVVMFKERHKTKTRQHDKMQALPYTSKAGE